MGIGGSHLGPQLACEALGSPLGAPRIHFLSNVDPAAWQALREATLPKAVDHALPASDVVPFRWPRLARAGVLPPADDDAALEREHV